MAPVRQLAYALKDPANAQARAAVVVPMVQTLLEMVGAKPVTLVPIPDSRGDTSANLALSYDLARVLDPLARVGVADVLRREGVVPSSRASRLAGGASLPPAAHGMYAEDVPRGPVVLVDNVVATGSTALAAHQALGKGDVLAWAVDERLIDLRMLQLGQTS